MIAIAQDGAQLGEFSVEQIRTMLSSGKLSGSALYWQQGMTEWRPLSEMPNLYSDKESRSHISRKQRAFMDYHGISYLPTTTRSQASALIDEAISSGKFPDSQWNTYKHLIHPDLYAKPSPSLSPKEELKEAKQRLSTAQDEYKKLKASGDADAEDIESAKQEVEDIREEIEDLKAQIEDDKLAKQEGTDEVSSFVDSWAEGYYEHSGEEVERFKKVVKKPTKTQYKALTEKLAADLGLGIAALSLDQFLCLYIQQYPEALKEPYKSADFPQLSLQIPKTYQQQLQIQNAANSGGNAAGTPKKGCLGIVMAVAAPLAALFMWGAVVLLR
jgi:hypothetical protein